MPDEFSLIARSDSCRVQAIAHKRAPVFGVQFHPERYDDAYPDGRIILANFFRLAKQAASQSGPAKRKEAVES